MIIDTGTEIDFSTFPETDGKPMADTETNLDQMIDLILDLRQPLVPRGHHVGGNLLIYWDPTNGLKHCAPDVFVALDAGQARRQSWKVWEEGKFPEVVMEIASPSTKNRDIREKVALYGALGAREYYIFDPAGDLDPAFRGYARQGAALLPVANPTGLSIFSHALVLEFRVVQGWLRVIDPATGQPIPTAEEERATLRAALHAARAQVRSAEERAAEQMQARHAAEEQATYAQRARLAAELRAAEMEAELARLRNTLAQMRPADGEIPPDDRA